MSTDRIHINSQFAIHFLASIHVCIARIRAFARAIWAISLGWRESLWATNRNITQDPKKPKRLKNAFLEYKRSSSSVRNRAKIRLMLATIILYILMSPSSCCWCLPQKEQRLIFYIYVDKVDFD